MKKTEKTRGRLLRWNRIKYALTAISFLVPAAVLLRRMLSGTPPENGAGYHSEADYLLMLLQCLLGFAALHLPSLLAKRFRFVLPTALYGMYITFLYCAIFLGEVRGFYYLVPHWDTVLHAFSSLLTGAFGVMTVTILNREEISVMRLSPFFTALFAFCFSLAIGTVWEIFEYTCDGIFGMNMQKYLLSDGSVLTGHGALTDTVKDLILDALGGLAASVLGYVSIARGLHWFIPELTGGD